MIASLRGVVGSRDDASVVVDVGGVGYRVRVSSVTMARIGPAGEPVSLAVVTQVREDAINLFGFADVAELHAFDVLMSVQGVGPSVALALLGSMPLPILFEAIADGDLSVISKAPGVGRKLAARLALDLHDKAQALRSVGGTRPTDRDALVRIASALEGLGYSKSEATVLVAKTLSDMQSGTSDDIIVRACLRGAK